MSDLRETVAAKRAEVLEHAPVPSTAAFGGIDGARVLAVIGLDPSDPKAHATVAVAQRYGLDPVLGHIMILPRSAMPYITRDGFLHIAHRSGQLDGIEVVDGPRREGAEWVASVSVWRKDMSRAFTYPGRAEVGRDNGPEMALARAERRALRRAFAVTLPAGFAEDEFDVRVQPEPQPEPASPRRAPAATTVTRHVEELELEPGHDRRPVTDTAPLDDVEPQLRTEAQSRRLWMLLREFGVTERTDALRLIVSITGREIESTKDLWRAEAVAVIDELVTRKEHADQEHPPADPDG